jgi:hypothetical protein
MEPRIAALFDEAVEMPPATRAAWLDDACGGDASLREAVERLLLADARSEDFLATPPFPIQRAVDDRGERLAPSAFGPFRVVRRLGEGGMGEVWLAERHDGEFQQRVAVKQVAWPTPGLLQRFREERRILARLEHPGIARLIDGGSDDGGAPWLAMEYVEGRSILEFADAEALDLRARLRLFLAVSGVWFFRVGLMFWIVANQGPVGFDPKTFTGPFLTFLAFAQYLLPLALLELYFRAEASTATYRRLAMAAALAVVTLAIAVGIVAAARILWLPHL